MANDFTATDAAASVAAGIPGVGPVISAARLIFGHRSRMTPEQVHQAGGLIMTGDGNTPPSAVMPNGARLFAVDTETDDHLGYTPQHELDAVAQAAQHGEDAARDINGEIPATGSDEPDAEDTDTNVDDAAADEGMSTPQTRTGGGSVPTGTTSTSETGTSVVDRFQREAGGAPAPDEAAPAGPDPVQGLIDLFKAEVTRPMPGFPGPRPLTMGEHVALGILGALDPEAFEREIFPMLQQERALPLAQAEWERQNHQHAIAAMQGLAQVMSLQQSRQSQEAGRLEEARHNKALESQVRGEHTIEVMKLRAQEQQAAQSAQHAKAMEDIARERNKIMAQKGTAPKPLDPATKRDLALAKQVKRQAQMALAFLRRHPWVGLPGANVGTYFSKDFSDFSALLGDVKTTFATARAGKRITEPELKLMGGSVPSMNVTSHQKVSGLEEMIRWADSHESAIREEFGMDGLPGEEQSGVPDPANAPAGFTPVGTEIDDDLLEAN